MASTEETEAELEPSLADSNPAPGRIVCPSNYINHVSSLLSKNWNSNEDVAGFESARAILSIGLEALEMDEADLGQSPSYHTIREAITAASLSPTFKQCSLEYALRSNASRPSPKSVVFVKRKFAKIKRDLLSLVEHSDCQVFLVIGHDKKDYTAVFGEHAIAANMNSLVMNNFSLSNFIGDSFRFAESSAAHQQMLMLKAYARLFAKELLVRSNELFRALKPSRSLTWSGRGRLLVGQKGSVGIQITFQSLNANPWILLSAMAL